MAISDSQQDQSLICPIVRPATHPIIIWPSLCRQRNNSFIVSQVFRLRSLPIYLIIRPPAQAHLGPAHLRHHSRLRDAEPLCLWTLEHSYALLLGTMTAVTSCLIIAQSTILARPLFSMVVLTTGLHKWYKSGLRHSRSFLIPLAGKCQAAEQRRIPNWVVKAAWPACGPFRLEAI